MDATLLFFGCVFLVVLTLAVLCDSLLPPPERCRECGFLIGGPIGDNCRCRYDAIDYGLEFLSSPSALIPRSWGVPILYGVGIAMIVMAFTH